MVSAFFVYRYIERYNKAMLRNKKRSSFSTSEVFAMSQLVGGAYQCNHVNSKGELIFDHYTVTGLSGVTKGWNRQSIRKAVEFLREEGLLKIYQEYSEDVDGEHNVGYKIILTEKGIQLATDRHAFTDYYRDLEAERSEKILSIKEKRANIYNPIVNLIVSTSVSALVSLYIFSAGDETTRRAANRIHEDSLRHELKLLKQKVDSLITPRYNTQKKAQLQAVRP